MERRPTARLILVATAGALLPLAAAATTTASAAEGSTARVHVVQVQDDCHRRSFNRAVGRGT
ncbi:MAG: hypothetical protein ACRDOJ_05255, partial [Nocardioidaceae bacterium]